MYRSLRIGQAALVAGALLMVGTPANAVDSSAQVVSEALHAVAEVDGGLVAASVPEGSSPADIPDAAGQPIVLEGSDVSVTVAGEKDVTTRGNSSVMVGTSPSTSTVVQPTKDGVQLMAVVDGPQGGNSQSYEITPPPGGQVTKSPDGTVLVLDADGNPSAVVEQPWAQDATGRQLPTSYTVSDGVLTQHIDMSGAVFPVVADPLVRHWWGIVYKFNRNQTNDVMFGMAGAAVASLGIPEPSVSKIVAGVLGAASAYANWAYNRGACLAVARPWIGPAWIYHYQGGACR